FRATSFFDLQLFRYVLGTNLPLMSNNRIIFYCIFAAFHLFLFFFSLYVDSQRENVQFLLTLQSKIWMLKYGSFLGLLLLGVAVLWDWRDMRAHRKEKDQLNHEIN